MLDKKFNRATLVLLYSGMDSMAFMSLPAGQDGVTRKDYIAWVEKYLRFPCAEQVTGLDLYAARCGLLHTFTPESDLSRNKRARPIVYINHRTPEISYDPNEPENIVVMSVEGLYNSFFTGVQKFLSDLHADKNRDAQVLARLDTMFHDISQE